MLKEEAGSSSQEAPAGPWDTTFNRALNRFKGRDQTLPPTSAGRVAGFGTSMKFIEYYSTDTEARKQRRKSGKAEVQELKEEVATLKKDMVDPATMNKLVADKVSETLQNMFPPGFMEGLAAWQAGGQQGPIYVPSFTGSNSSNNVSPATLVTPQVGGVTSQPMVTPPVPPVTSLAQVTPPVPLVTPLAPPRLENDEPAAGALVSTLAELNALDKVTNF